MGRSNGRYRYGRWVPDYSFVCSHPGICDLCGHDFTAGTQVELLDNGQYRHAQDYGCPRVRAREFTDIVQGKKMWVEVVDSGDLKVYSLEGDKQLILQISAQTLRGLKLKKD